MKHHINKITAKLMPFIGMCIFIVLLIASIVFFSYIFIIGAIIGLILLVIGYIRSKLLHAKILKARAKYHQQQQHPERTEHSKGRTIEHEPNETRF